MSVLIADVGAAVKNIPFDAVGKEILAIDWVVEGLRSKLTSHGPIFVMP
jgi:hypothetical protein